MKQTITESGTFKIEQTPSKITLSVLGGNSISIVTKLLAIYSSTIEKYEANGYTITDKNSDHYSFKYEKSYEIEE